MANIALLIAGGAGARMHQNIPKQFLTVNERPVIVYTLEAFQQHPEIDEIAVVCIHGWEPVLLAYADQFNITKLKYVVPGGENGQESIKNGVFELEKHYRDDDIVLIHDGARPFVSHAIINETIEVAKQKKAAVVGVPVRDTIKVVENGVVKNTPARETLWSAQTPQTFDKDLILRAYENAYQKNFYGTDDSMLVEFLGQEVTMVLGSYENIKITNPEDINVAEQILDLRKKSKVGKRIKKIG